MSSIFISISDQQVCKNSTQIAVSITFYSFLLLLPAGIINAYSVEYEALKIAASNSSIIQNISINVQQFDFSESSHLFNQGMMTGSN